MAEDSPWDEHHLNWHYTYVSVFNDPATRKGIAKNRDKLAQKGIISALYEVAPGEGEG